MELTQQETRVLIDVLEVYLNDRDSFENDTYSEEKQLLKKIELSYQTKGVN